MRNIIKIGDKLLDSTKEVFVISEIGINHEGDVNLCAKMIRDSVDAGADSIKLQTIDAEENYSKSSISYSLFKKSWLTEEETSNMFDYARSLGVEPFTTVGDLKTLEWIKNLKPKIYKVSSGLITHLPLIKKISKLNKTVIMSSGTANKSELDSAVGVFNKSSIKNLVLLHCVSSYPTPFNQANLAKISALKSRYNIPVGYSDHVMGYNACLASVILQSCVIEKHFTFDINRKNFDHHISLQKEDFYNMVKEIKLYKEMCGKENIWVSEIENKNKKWMRRIIVAKSDLLKGHYIRESDILFLRPAAGKRGLKPKDFNLIVGKRVKKNINKLCPIKFNSLYD